MYGRVIVSYGAVCRVPNSLTPNKQADKLDS